MALNRWFPRAKKVAQVATVSITAYDATTTYKVTCNTKVVSVLGSGGTTTTVATALQAALAASTEPEFKRIVWTTSTNTVIGTARVAGVPFPITVSVSGGAGTISLAATTANSSPNDINDALNWTDGIPDNGDDILIDLPGIENSMFWNLGALSAVTVASITRRQSAKGARIGLPEVNREGAAFTEYMATEFAIGLQSGFTALIECDALDAAESIKLNTGSTQTTLTVRGQSPTQLGSEQVWWRGTSASNVVNVENGSLAIGVVNNNAATVPTLNANNSTVRLGAGLTITTVNNTRSTIKTNAALTTLTQNSGSFIVEGNALNMTTATIQGGVFDYRGTGTITTLVIGSKGAADFSQDNRARIVTNTISMYKGATLKDPARTLIAGGLDITAVGCLLKELNIDVGNGSTITVA